MKYSLCPFEGCGWRFTKVQSPSLTVTKPILIQSGCLLETKLPTDNVPQNVLQNPTLTFDQEPLLILGLLKLGDRLESG